MPVCFYTKFLASYGDVTMFSKAYSKPFLVSMFGSCFSDKLIISFSRNDELSSPQAFVSTFVESVSVEPTVPFIFLTIQIFITFNVFFSFPPWD